MLKILLIVSATVFAVLVALGMLPGVVTYGL